MPQQLNLSEIILITIACLVGIPFYLYVVSRWLSTAIFWSYFEIKYEFFLKKLKEEKQYETEGKKGVV
jgi:hypothetical protein